MNCFRHMYRLDFIRAREIGNGSRNTDNPSMGSSRQPEFRQRAFQEFLRRSIQNTVPLQEPRLQLRIRVNPVLTISVALSIARR